jgi:hypothetical protein
MKADAITGHVACMQEMTKLHMNCGGEVPREMSMLETWTYIRLSYKNVSS